MWKVNGNNDLTPAEIARELERLGNPLPENLVVDLFLSSLPKSYDAFVRSHNMHSWEKSVAVLHQMLVAAERNIQAQVLEVGRTKAGGSKRKNKIGYKHAEVGTTCNQSDICLNFLNC
ncbi:hypothetical protein CTI12_AA123220 [Artemisia annua]|uniref:Uncharacterized protein n=1 Tax=Artemisia annua TaxID=35608 RepID=A0A2U1PQU4_ARTAN|nr:hypothetical protein CTI12_AA123220 [Artemisia annua]